MLASSVFAGKSRSALWRCRFCLQARQMLMPQITTPLLSVPCSAAQRAGKHIFRPSDSDCTAGSFIFRGFSCCHENRFLQISWCCSVTGLPPTEGQIFFIPPPTLIKLVPLIEMDYICGVCFSSLPLDPFIEFYTSPPLRHAATPVILHRTPSCVHVISLEVNDVDLILRKPQLLILSYHVSSFQMVCRILLYTGSKDEKVQDDT